jgi:regulator of protease activity HflC (stomatin/prohibitin superfamily)
MGLRDAAKALAEDQRDAAKALAEGQRAARSAAPEWGHATPQKLWPKANAQPGA